MPVDGTDGTLRVAVLSDVHGNLAALRQVLGDLDSLGIGEIAVAGDMVGFGADPDAVVDLLVGRSARMIRGNHEKDYVAPYGTPAMPEWWLTDPRLRSMRWSMELLGADRRAFLSRLPDRLALDEATLVVHGSPRHVRDAVLPWTPDDELEAMFHGETATLAFMGHTHRAVIRDLKRRRLVNVGSVGLPIDGDPRASYAIATRAEGRASGGWDVTIRRLAYDVEAAIAAYDGGLRAVDPGYVKILSRQLRTARDYFGPWLRASREIRDEDLPAALEKFLEANP